MKTINPIITNKRRAIFSTLKGYCPTTINREDKGDFIEITEWINGEGFDINISDVMGFRILQVTYGEYKLIKKLVKYLNKESNETR